MKNFFVLFIVFFLSFSAIFSKNAFASGYLLNEYSVTSLGRAFAGVGVVGDDLSAIASNPAGLQLFDRTVGAQVGATVITLNGKFNGTESILGNQNGNVLTLSKQSGSARVEIQEVVPNFFAAYALNDRIKFGLGVYVPFGLGTTYSDNSIVQLSAIESQLQVIEIAPSMSWNIWKGLSIGATVNVQHGAATLTQSSPNPLNPLSGELLYTKVQGDTWAVGGSVGLIYDFGETSAGDKSVIGISYRSQVKHGLEGTMNVYPLVERDVTADMYLPNVVTLSAYHKFKAPVGLSATLRYIQWSIFDSLEIKGSGQPRIHEDWRDTFSAHIGVDWFVDPSITLRAGFAYDMTPIKDAEHRTARIPDNDRFLLSFGLTAKPHESWQIDVGYTHLFLTKASINNTHSGLNINGEYSYDALSYLIGVQVQYKF